jgi:hypothetical protein
MSIKDALKNQEEWLEHTLTEQEANYVLAVHNGTNLQIAGFLSTVAANRFGYPSDKPLQFDTDFNDPEHKVKIRIAPVPEP